MTQLEAAVKGIITKEMKAVAEAEDIPVSDLMRLVATGKAVIPANKNHANLHPVGIGKGMKVKVNANIGNSPLRPNIEWEEQKLQQALAAGADTVMDLSTADNALMVLERIVHKSPVPVGTVPIYMAMAQCGNVKDLSIETYLDVLRQQAQMGVDFVTVHAGVTRKSLELSKNRIIRCVSRGGSFLLKWMEYHERENFLYQHFDAIIEIAKQYDVTLSLGDGMRPGCIADASDKAQIEELKTLGTLARKARAKGVQVMIEGPGHVPLHQIEYNVKLEKHYCDEAPFYVLGPLPTDIAAGYDHIAAAIGGALAAWKGADFLCYVTCKEHVGLPNPQDVYEGVMVTKLAAHIGDIARGRAAALEQNRKMSEARGRIDWDQMLKYALAPSRLEKMRIQECKQNPELANADFCSMCGEFCAYRVVENRK